MARLILTNPPDRKLVRARAKKTGQYVSHARRGRLLVWAFAAVVLIVFVLVPVMADRLAEFLPPEAEKALGNATFNQIRIALVEAGFSGLETCDAPAGLAALQKIETRLFANLATATPLTVYARDPTRIALRSAGSIGVLGSLFRDFASGALVLFLAERIIQADYTQQAEAEADIFAHAALRNADLPPSAIATFFARLAQDDGKDPNILDYFMSHPALGDRIIAARAAQPPSAAFRPLHMASEWKDLRTICD